MGSEDYATSNPGSGEDGTSLAARRARLRGTLAKQAAPPDPYKPDPYMMAPAPEQAASTMPTAPAPSEPAVSAEPQTTPSGAAMPATPAPSPAQAPEPAPESSAGEVFSEFPGAAPPAPDFPAAPLPSPPTASFASPQIPSSSFSDFTASMFATAEAAAPGSASVDDSLEAESAALAAELAEAAANAEKTYGNSGNGGGTGTSSPSLSAAAFFAAAGTPVADASSKTEERPSFFSEPEVESVPEPEPEKTATPTARVDRRRQSSAAATMPPIPEPAAIPAAVDPDSITDLNYMPSDTKSSKADAKSSASTADATSSSSSSADDAFSSSATPSASPLPPGAVPPNAMPGGDVPMSSGGNYVYGLQPHDPSLFQAPALVQSQAIEIMNNIDQAMGACAMNLSELQKIASEQTDALKGVAETLQNQSFFEMGLNINSLVDTLAAALEPMKAVGELVPALDQLVAMMESREGSGASASEEKLSREQLVTSLAEQLSSGMIDPWTFKCAYMAVFPAEHPADLLHRLVDLLGTQRLSGDLFRAAYDAVQAPDPPPRTAVGGDGKPVVQVVQDETLLAQLEELKRTNEEFSRRNDEIQKKLEAKDQEFNQVLSTKEQELQEAQELLNSRWEEFNTRYDELTETLHKRDEVLQEREAELAKKESENTQLRSQMEELRDQTKEMVADLQRQLSAKPKEEPPKQPGFFDVAPGTQQAQPAPQQAGQPGQLFDAGPSRPLFGQTDAAQPQAAPAAAPEPSPQMQAPQPAPQPALAQPMAPQPAQAAGNQAVPRPAAPTTPFVSGAGSYGSGVRAQVFEVIVRQALAGAPWREICAGPMQVNNISPEEVETEVKRRQALLKK
jgi:sec-independent protein translocase protein TatB